MLAHGWLPAWMAFSQPTRTRGCLLSARAQRILGVVVVAVALCVFVAIYVTSLTRSPQAATRSADLTLQTVGALGPKYEHPDWVSYLVRDPGGEWLHSTTLEVPADSLVRVTIHQYDSATGLRNPFFARPQGTVGNVIQIDGKTADVIDPALTSHTFAILPRWVVDPESGLALMKP